MTVVPALTPVTKPIELIAATEGEPDDQLPPPVELVSNMFDPSHTAVNPDMEAGSAVIVTAITA
jgi:hypothetical protein